LFGRRHKTYSNRLLYLFFFATRRSCDGHHDLAALRHALTRLRATSPFDLFGARNTTRRPPVTSRARHSPSSRRLPREVDQQPTFRACSLTSAICYVITCALVILFTSPTHAGDYLNNLGRLQLTPATCCIDAQGTTDHQRCIADLFGISARRPRLR
jgi:hypothetical protein